MHRVTFSGQDPRQLISDTISDILRPDVLRPLWSQETLAGELGVTQGTLSKWKNGVCIPRPGSIHKLLQIHRQAVCHHWDCENLVPLCAIASSYPDTLRRDALNSLAATLNAAPLSTPLERRNGAGFRVDLHIRPATLPSGVSAYTFVNDPSAPLVFVVLISASINLAAQTDLAWREVYAHVAKYRVGEKVDDERASALPLSVSPSPVIHFKIN